jgi:DNA mismatch repair protein MutL
VGKIQLMPESLANKIAAGEVVERPASVIKELVENSIDANSTWIKVELVEAGLTSIRITDNGDGMTEEDCKRAFFRHATSKITSEEDLFRVQTLGFRGEALASIAAVSRLTMRTSTGEEAGNILYLEGGKIVSHEKSDARKGTEITVSDLFYNTPARLKYMKTIHTELGHITDVLNRMALSYPNIRFECYHNKKQLFYTSGRGDLLQVISQIYGMDTARKMIPVQHSTLDFDISGYIAKPEINRANRNYISTIVNGRYIRNHMVNRGILQGYHTLLPIGRYPIVVLRIDMDPYLVDVNVHPAKLEVRFSKEKELFSAVEEAIKLAFRSQTLIPEISKEKKKKEQSVQTTFTFDQQNPYTSPKVESWKKEKIFENLMPKEPIYESKKSIETNQTSSMENLEPTSITMEEEMDEELEITVEEQKERLPVLYPVGQVHGTYIVAQNEQGLYLIDQHAAQERIKYEYFREQVGVVARELQQLLVPITFEFTQKEAILIEEYREELKQVGLFFEPFGDHTYIIRSYPTWFPKGEEEEIIREMVEQVVENQKIDIKKLREEAAILMSCKRSIKANHYLTTDDMSRLLDDLRNCQDPFTCPHGRPIVIFFSEYELEKMFKRVM